MKDTSDPYTGSGGVMTNLLGITDPEKLKLAEADASTFRMELLRKDPIKGNFDLAHEQAIHRYIFQDVYPWAGELRTVGISKGISQFARPEYIESEAAKLFSRLKSENHLKGMFTDPFVDRAAHYFTEINALHPHREGNGRTLQVFMEQLGREAGRPMDFSKISHDAMILGATLAHNSGSVHMKPIIQSALREGRLLLPDQGR